MECRHGEVEANVHATEDLDRVVPALRSLLGEGPLLLEVYFGHHGNRIVRVYAYLKDCAPLLRRICEEVGAQALRGHPDGMYVRLDKQALVLGRLEPGVGDDVVRIRFRAVKGGPC